MLFSVSVRSCLFKNGICTLHWAKYREKDAHFGWQQQQWRCKQQRWCCKHRRKYRHRSFHFAYTCNSLYSLFVVGNMVVRKIVNKSSSLSQLMQAVRMVFFPVAIGHLNKFAAIKLIQLARTLPFAGSPKSRFALVKCLIYDFTRINSNRCYRVIKKTVVAAMVFSKIWRKRAREKNNNCILELY